MIEVYMCVNRGDLHEELVERLKKAIEKIAHENNLEVDVKIKDVGLYGEATIDNPSFVFGTFTKSQTIKTEESIPIFYMPDLERLENVPGNKKTRSEASKKIMDSVKSLSPKPKKIEKAKESYAAEKDGTTVGTGDKVDIDIPQDKIEYLQRIKNLLNSKKVIVRKGDIEIEFV